jgi:rhodanese-related sulfurtransferase
MGVLQALEAIKALAGLGDGAAGRMLCFDAAAAPGRSFRAFALRPRNPTCVACGDGEEVRVEKKITPETLANGEDLTAFVERRDSHAEGDENAKTTRASVAARRSKPRTPPPQKNARIRDGKTSSSRGEEDRAACAALVGALDDAKSAAARNRDQGRGSPGGVVGFPARDPGEASRHPSDRGTIKGPPRFAGVDVAGAPPRVEASFLPPVALDCSARPPLLGSEPGPNRVSPSALRAALAGSTLAGGSSSFPSGGGGVSEPAVLVVDVRPRRLSDAACLRRALRVPLRELEARVGEVWAASDALRDAAARDARNRSLDGGGPGPGAVYVVCSRGNDSQLAEAFLRAAGLPVVGDVVGGMEGWRTEIDPTFPKLV